MHIISIIWSASRIAVPLMLAAHATAASPLPVLFELRAPPGLEARATVSARQIEPRFDVLKSLAARRQAGETPSFALDLGEGGAYVAEVTDSENAQNGATSVAFRIPGAPRSSGIATTLGDVMLVDVRIDGAHYAVKRTAQGTHVVEQAQDGFDKVELPPMVPTRPGPPLSPGRGGSGAPGLIASEGSGAPGSTSPEGGSTPGSTAPDGGAPAAGADVPVDTGRLVDTMILWNGDARTGYGGGSDATMQTLAAQSVAAANQVYKNSGIAQRLRLVYAGAVTYTACSPGTSGYWACTLEALTDGTGTLAGVAALRDTHGADLVTLLVQPPGGSTCGIAWIVPDLDYDWSDYGYSVVEATCAVGNLSYPHELGHNMGATHDTYVDSDTDYVKPYNHGYVNLANRWRTVMAYNDQCAASGFNCARIAWMANPDYSVDADGAGGKSPVVMGDASLRNVARVLNLTAKTIAAFRPTSASHPIGASFSDVPMASPQFGAIEFMKQAGITTGCTASTYCPDDPITRRQMAVFLERTRRNAPYEPPAATGVFSDVPPGSQFAAFIEQLAADGITTGCSPGLYCPDQPVTRTQMALFLLRASCGTSYTPAAATGTIFADVGAADTGAAYVEKLYRMGVTGGCATGPLRYCPAASLSRGQMAVFIERMVPFIAPSEACTP